MASEEVSEHFVYDMREPGSAPKVNANTALLRPIECPVVQRWICGRVDR